MSNRARLISQYEALGFNYDQAVEEAAREIHESRPHVRAGHRLRRAWLAVLTFLRHDWANLLWSLFVAMLAGIAFRDVAVWVFVTAAVVAFHWRLWKMQEQLIDAKRALKRAYMANRVLQGAVESSAEYIVEQRMAMEGTPLGPVVWIDGRAFPVDDDGVAHYDDEPELWVGDEKTEG